VGAQLARGRVVGHHLGGDLGRDADALGGEQQVEDLRLEHDPAAGLGVDRVPVVGPAVGADAGEVDRQAVLLRPVADDAIAGAREVDAEEEALGQRQLGLAQSVGVEVEQRELVLQGADLASSSRTSPRASRSWFSESPLCTWIANERGTTSR
jgi:hypothetical protein